MLGAPNCWEWFRERRPLAGVPIMLLPPNESLRWERLPLRAALWGGGDAVPPADSIGLEPIRSRENIEPSCEVRIGRLPFVPQPSSAASLEIDRCK